MLIYLLSLEVIILLDNKLKEIRMREFMFTQKEFSSFLSIPESQFYRYEMKKSQPSLEIALKIAQKLDRPISEIWWIENQSE